MIRLNYYNHDKDKYESAKFSDKFKFVEFVYTYLYKFSDEYIAKNKDNIYSITHYYYNKLSNFINRSGFLEENSKKDTNDVFRHLYTRSLHQIDKINNNAASLDKDSKYDIAKSELRLMMLIACVLYSKRHI